MRLSPPPLARIRPGQLYAWRGSSLLVVTPDGSVGAADVFSRVGQKADRADAENAAEPGAGAQSADGRTAEVRPDHGSAEPHAHALGDLTGWYFRQTRFLSSLRLTLDGIEPFFCSSAEAAPHFLELAYIHPPVTKGGGGGSGSGASGSRHGVLFRDIDVRLGLEVHPASLDVVLRVTNRWQDEVLLEIGWALDADYATVDEAHFGVREEPVRVTCRQTPGGVTFHSEHPKLPVQTIVMAEGADWRWEGARFRASVPLSRQETTQLRLRVHAVDPTDPITEGGERRREAKVAAWREGVARLHAPGESPLVEIIERALDDVGALALLEGPEEEWLTLGAGVPLYQSLWGRDALTAAWQLSVFDRGETLAGALTKLTRMQGRMDDPERDEEPGRILNQGKMDPASRLGGRPFTRSYADFASPFDFIIGLGYRWALTGEIEAVEPHIAAAHRVLDWARTRGDPDGDGYLEYLTRSSVGPTHQGWKDSENAVVRENGEQVEPPIAPCEVQGYWYASLQIMSALALARDDRAGARALWQEAAELKRRFNRDFWMQREGYLAFGLDADKRPIRALTSNAGQCLATGVVSDEHVPRLVHRMFEPDLFSGWGIRTLDSGNPAYNPLDYHLGSVWPVENGTILFGLRRYGLNEQAERLARALYDLARLWPGGRAPECVGGYGREEYAHPSVYPRANAPQTWNQSMLPMLVQSLLGLVPFAPLGVLLVDPVLPAWLPELTVRNLRVGEATVALRFRREADGRSSYEVLEKTGALRVLRQAWLQSFSQDVWSRLGDLVETVRA
jgi:glycogen debranching enzyme